MRRIGFGVVAAALLAGCGGGGGSSSSGNPFAGTRSGTYAASLYGDGLTPAANPAVVGTSTITVTRAGSFTAQFGPAYSLTGTVDKNGNVTGAVFHYQDATSNPATIAASNLAMTITGSQIDLAFDAYLTTTPAPGKGLHYNTSLSP